MKSSMRSGCTVTWGSNIDFVRCQFRDSQGQPPEAGVNIEPNYEREVNSAISFHDCIFTGNARRGMKIDLKKRYNRLAGLDVVGCRFFANKSNDGAQMQLSGKDLSLLEMINITGNEFDQRLWTGSSSGTTTFRNVTIDKNIFMKGGVSVWNLNRGSQNVVFSTNRWRKAPTLKSVAFTPTFIGNVMI